MFQYLESDAYVTRYSIITLQLYLQENFTSLHYKDKLVNGIGGIRAVL
jgi:hypothetical protein